MHYRVSVCIFVCEPCMPTLSHRPAYDADSPSDEERREVPVQRKSSLTELGNKITALIMPNKTLVVNQPLVFCYHLQPGSTAFYCCVAG